MSDRCSSSTSTDIPVLTEISKHYGFPSSFKRGEPSGCIGQLVLFKQRAHSHTHLRAFGGRQRGFLTTARASPVSESSSFSTATRYTTSSWLLMWSRNYIFRVIHTRKNNHTMIFYTIFIQKRVYYVRRRLDYQFPRFSESFCIKSSVYHGKI